MYCAQCKTENEEGSNFCIHCGSPIAAQGKKPYRSAPAANSQSSEPVSLLQNTLYLLKNNAFVFYGLLSFLIFIGIGYYFDFGKNPHIFTVKSKHAETNKNNHQAKQPELCDRIGVLKRCNDLIAENNARSCLNLSDRFFEKCGDYDQLHNYRNTAARRISEWKIALESANKLIELYPFSPNPHFIRAGTHKEMGDYRSAITDYEQTLALMPGEIQSPFELVNLYERLRYSPLSRPKSHKIKIEAG